MADGAHAFGASWHNQAVGSIADFTNFSFHAVKNFTTGEGGAATWKEIEGIDSKNSINNINCCHYMDNPKMP